MKYANEFVYIIRGDIKKNSIIKDIVQIVGREVNMINTVSKIQLSKIGGEGGGSASIWIIYCCCFLTAPLIHLKMAFKSVKYH